MTWEVGFSTVAVGLRLDRSKGFSASPFLIALGSRIGPYATQPVGETMLSGAGSSVRAEVPMPGFGFLRAERYVSTADQEGMFAVALLSDDHRGSPRRWQENALYLPGEALAPLYKALGLLLGSGGDESLPTRVADL